MGWQGPGNTEAFLSLPDCQVVAACDIDANHLQAAVKKVNDAYGNEDCKGYHDYRELLRGYRCRHDRRAGSLA